MVITYTNHVSAIDYGMLRASAGWPGLAKEQLEAGISNSSYIAGVYDGEQCIGMGRILWDGGYVAYLADVIVLPEYQQMGIGTCIVRMCEDYVISELKPGWKIQIIGIAAYGKDEFYRGLGYGIRPNEEAGAGFNKWFEREE